MDNREVIFRRDFLFSKSDLLESLGLWIEHEKENEDHEHSEIIIQNRIALADRFASVIRKSHLPILNDMWQFYEYTYKVDRMLLELCEAENFEVDEDECPSMSVHVIGELLCVECEILTVRQFADMHKIKPVTVELWLKHGKLRHAKKTDAGWMIPNTEDRPRRAFEHAFYTVNPLEQIISDEFPILAMAENIDIKQSDIDKNIYICSIYNFNKNFNAILELNKSDVERLEFLLISTNGVQIESPVQFVPLLDKDETL